MIVKNLWSDARLQSFLEEDKKSEKPLLTNYTIENALIEEVGIGYNDRNWLEAFLILERETGHQHFICQFLCNHDPYNAKYLEQLDGESPKNFLGKFIRRTLDTVGCGNWEKLKNKPLRIVVENHGFGYIRGIGNHLKDQWFFPCFEFDGDMV